MKDQASSYAQNMTSTLHGRSDRMIDLPDAFIAHPLGAATSHPEYPMAKAGNLMAARKLAADLITGDFLEHLRQEIGNARPIVIPVLAIEQAGRNKIPLTVSEAISSKLGLPIKANIYQARKSFRSSASGLDRVFIPSEFAGEVVCGRSYLLVDDTLTQGGTIATLADHIQRSGGAIAGIVFLTGKKYSRKLSLSHEALQRVRSKFGDIEPAFREATGRGFDSLTESEARALAAWKPADAVRSRILAERDAGRSDDPATAP
jgi:hypoxanthine-guanine phosphoribosyltransferase